MSEGKIFMRVEEVAETLGISKSHAYKIVHQLNKEMAQMGYITVSGRVNRKYFMKKLRETLTGIQSGEIAGPEGWVVEIA